MVSSRTRSAGVVADNNVLYGLLFEPKTHTLNFHCFHFIWPIYAVHFTTGRPAVILELLAQAAEPNTAPSCR